MSATCVISEAAFQATLDRLMAEMPVIGPVERPGRTGFYRFARLERAADLARDYTTTTLPPKTVFFPPVETLFTFDLEGAPQIEPPPETLPFVLAGVHPCDLAALDALDTAYGFPPAEALWQERRRQAFVIGMECHPDSYCFCTSMGTAESRAGADLFLTPVEGGYLVEMLTASGRMLLKDTACRVAGPRDHEAATAVRRRKAEAVTAHLEVPVEDLADILDLGGLTDIWRETASRCYSCGSCNTTCPTCFCFIIDASLTATLDGGSRQRRWDACQLLDFARVAGGHNYRKERWQRVRHRWHRKFLYLYRRFGRPFCTGCGRCSRACTADINIVAITNRLAAHFYGERTP
jgi:sulfhydrogenase subunit beta (sulfur reductase)